MNPRFGLMVDFRNPPEARRDDQTVYAETLETICFAEELGYDDVWLSEHHFTADGYCPSPLVVSAAIAARTSRICIGQALLLLPLHHPLRVAEDGATLDVLSGGRFRLGVGLGYRPEEFAALGIDRRSRVSRLEESVAIIDQAWRTGAVTFHGRKFDLDDVAVRPRPVQQPRPEIWIGGLSEPAVRRAARLGDGLLAAGRRAYQWYTDERARAGLPAGPLRIAGAHEWYFVDRQPQQLLERVAANLLLYHNTVAGFFATAGQPMPMGPAQPAGLDEILASGRYIFCTPDECVRRLTSYLREVPVSHFYLLGGLPGLPGEVARGWLELFARQVAPGVRAALNPAGG
jgi:probable F420-dependent oxidoreductase